MKRLISPLLLTLSLLFISCGGGGGGDTSALTSETFSSSENAFVNDLFHTEYLWFDEVTDVDYNDYDTPQSLIDALKVSQDKWSFSLTKQEYEDMVNQKTAGFGFGYTDGFQLYLVRIDSPAWGKLLRGDIIREINGEVVSNDNIAAASQNLNVATTFTVDRLGTEENIVITPREYTFKVTQGKILNGNIGYLRYDSFTGTSVDEYEAEFTVFNDKNISELIIDLRYNGGGSVDTTSALIDNIINIYPGEKQMYLDWNANYQNKNTNYSFETADLQDGNELNMKRVIFLVTKNSASASEALINALVPYLGASNVVTIGEATHGKPVGMSGKKYGSNIYFLINFFVNNNNDTATSFDGIPPTCLAQDDLSKLRGTQDEVMLNVAIQFITKNKIGQSVCP